MACGEIALRGYSADWNEADSSAIAKCCGLLCGDLEHPDRQLYSLLPFPWCRNDYKADDKNILSIALSL